MITIQRPDPASPRDSAGQVLTAWLPVATTAAAVEPLSGNEAVIAAQQQATTSHKVTVRWSPRLDAVDSTYRIVFGDRVFMLDGDPTNVNEDNLTLEMMCTEHRE